MKMTYNTATHTATITDATERQIDTLAAAAAAKGWHGPEKTSQGAVLRWLTASAAAEILELAEVMSLRAEQGHEYNMKFCTNCGTLSHVTAMQTMCCPEPNQQYYKANIAKIVHKKWHEARDAIKIPPYSTVDRFRVISKTYAGEEVFKVLDQLNNYEYPAVFGSIKLANQSAEQLNKTATVKAKYARFCNACGCIGEIPQDKRNCCPDANGQYYTTDKAERLKTEWDRYQADIKQELAK